MKHSDHTNDVLELKAALRAQMNRAAAAGGMDGHDVLAALMSLGAELVARVDDERVRREFVDSVVGFFPHAVTIERETRALCRKRTRLQ